jgi:iron(III) transport system permease protein
MVGALVALGPLVYVFDRARSRGLDEVRNEIWQRRTFDLVVRSLTLMLVVTMLCVVIGVAAAIVVGRTDVPFRRVWQVVLALPLSIPTYVAAYTWIAARPSLAGFHGATLVLTLCSYPYVYLPVLAAVSRLDPAQEEVARSLGHSSLSVVWRVTLPQLRPAIAAGGLLVALYVLSDFGAVGTMRYEVFTWVIFGAYNAGFNPARAAILSLVLVVCASLVVMFELRARGAAQNARVGGGSARPAPLLPLGQARPVVLAAIVSLLGAAIAFPVGSLLRLLTRGVDRGVDWSALSSALGTSLRLSLLAAIVTTVMAAPVGVLAARFRTRSSVVIERATYFAHALPGIVIAISMVYTGVRLLRPVYQETPLLVLTYAVLFLPLSVASVRAAIEQSPPVFEDVARSLGRRHLVALLTVTARLAAPGLAAGAAMVFLATMKELPATLLLHPTGTETLSTRLWQRSGVSDYGGAAPFAAALVVFAAAPTAVLGWWSGRLGDFPND